MVLVVKLDAAISALQELKNQAEVDPMALCPPGPLDTWRSKVMVVMERALGKDSQILSVFSAIQYGLVYVSDSTTEIAWRSAFQRGLLLAVGQVEAAIYQLQLMGEEDEVKVDDHGFDPDLWAYVKGLVENKDWDKVASAAVTFVENHFRVWTGSPKNTSGGNFVGKTLFTQILGKESDYRLGNEAGEWEGWLYLGMGFAQALGNRDRHNVKKREDVKLYALGVLGLGSLLLTQMRYQHGDILNSDGND